MNERESGLLFSKLRLLQQKAQLNIVANECKIYLVHTKNEEETSED